MIEPVAAKLCHPARRLPHIFRRQQNLDMPARFKPAIVADKLTDPMPKGHRVDRQRHLCPVPQRLAHTARVMPGGMLSHGFAFKHDHRRARLRQGRS